MQPSVVPPYQQFLWPIVTALRELGDSGSIDEIVSTVLRREDLSDLQQQVLHGDGPQTEIEYPTYAVQLAVAEAQRQEATKRSVSQAMSASVSTLIVVKWAPSGFSSSLTLSVP